MLKHSSIHPRVDGTDIKKLMLIKFWDRGLSHSYRPLEIDLHDRYRELFLQVQVLKRSFGSGEDIFDNTPVASISPPSSEKEPSADQQSNVPEHFEAQEIHGFDEREKDQSG